MPIKMPSVVLLVGVNNTATCSSLFDAGRDPASAADAGQGAARVRRWRALAGEPPPSVVVEQQHRLPAPPGQHLQLPRRRRALAGAHGQLQGRRRHATTLRQGGRRRPPVPGAGHDEEHQVIHVE
jgi:hypothetical protein